MSFNRVGRIMTGRQTDAAEMSLAIHATKKLDRDDNLILRVQVSMGKEFAKKRGFRAGDYVELFWGEDENKGTAQFARMTEGPRLRIQGNRLIYASTRVPTDMHLLTTTAAEVISSDENSFIFEIPPEVIVDVTPVPEPEPDREPLPQPEVEPSQALAKSRTRNPAIAQPEHEGFARVNRPPRKTFKVPPRR